MLIVCYILQRDGLQAAVLAGFKELLENNGLSSGKSSRAMRAVSECVAVLEDHYAFNAGYGSVVNTDGFVEMDAAVMEGKTLNFGGVLAIGEAF